MVFSCFAVYVLANNTRVVRYFESCIAPFMFKSLFKSDFQIGDLISEDISYLSVSLPLHVCKTLSANIVCGKLIIIEQLTLFPLFTNNLY